MSQPNRLSIKKLVPDKGRLRARTVDPEDRAASDGVPGLPLRLYQRRTLRSNIPPAL